MHLYTLSFKTSFCHKLFWSNKIKIQKRYFSYKQHDFFFTAKPTWCLHLKIPRISVSWETEALSTASTTTSTGETSRTRTRPSTRTRSARTSLTLPTTGIHQECNLQAKTRRWRASRKFHNRSRERRCIGTALRARVWAKTI